MGVSSFSGGVGGHKFRVLVVLIFDYFRILLRILLRVLLRILLWILLRVLLRSFPKGFTNNFMKDFNKDLSPVLVLSRAKRATRGRTTTRCESNEIDG